MDDNCRRYRERRHRHGLVVYRQHCVFNPIKDLLNVTKRVANGDFSVQLKEKKKKNGELKTGEMATLTHHFNIMVNELDKTKTLRSDFVANISHEFKTPLANIKGHAELIKKMRR